MRLELHNQDAVVLVALVELARREVTGDPTVVGHIAVAAVEVATVTDLVIAGVQRPTTLELERQDSTPWGFLSCRPENTHPCLPR